MKFRAGLVAKDLSLLNGVAQCFEKIGPSCLIYLSERSIKFASPKLGSDDVRVFSEIEQEKIFRDYRIESLANNSILFEIGLSNLIKSFTSAKTAQFVKLKLAKRGGQPCICLEARALDIELLHEIPIRVMRAADIQYYAPPDVPVPRVQLELPYNRSMRTVLERFKSMDRFCFVDGDMGGSLRLHVQNDRCHVQTFYGNLIPRYSEGMAEDEEGREDGGTGFPSCSIKLDTRRLLAALYFLGGIKYETALCCLIEASCLVLHVALGGHAGSLTYYLPIYLV
ncbi:checkpoint protein [Nannochloropsis oceanica]